MKTFIGVRGVDEETYNRFRRKAVADRVNLGKALTDAMKKYIEDMNKEKKPNIENIRRIKGMIKGKEKIRWSEEIDEVLYGK